MSCGDLQTMTYKKLSTRATKTSVICAVKRKWTYEVVTFAGRASDLGAWAETPFFKSITIESGVLGLADKGVNDKKNQDLSLHAKSHK